MAILTALREFIRDIRASKEISRQLYALIEEAQHCGLPEHDAIAAREYIEYHEPGVCFDLLVDRLYEYPCIISRDYYERVHAVAQRMGIEPTAYIFLEEVIEDTTTNNSTA